MSSSAPMSRSMWIRPRFHLAGKSTNSISFGQSSRHFLENNRFKGVAQDSRRAMKITRVESIHLRLPEVNERCDGSQETLLVRVHTDAGITGVGEVDSSGVVAKAIIEAPLSHKICRGLAECVLGQDPFEIDRLIYRMIEGSIYYGRQGAAIQAMSGIEIALWDIVGKAVGRPVYKLLGGGFRKTFRAYASILFGETPGETETIGKQ